MAGRAIGERDDCTLPIPRDDCAKISAIRGNFSGSIFSSTVESFYSHVSLGGIQSLGVV